MLFAVTDIETTGGHVADNRITEVAICLFDGSRIVERFESLVNPELPIPRFVQSLTGISNQMVALAPRFETLAPRIFELLQGKVFVAHNVNFDYSFLHFQLAAAGFQLQCPKLCTVRYARKLHPKLQSYSLGKLCAHFGLPIHNRHRAGGDATATAGLLQLLISHDRNNHLQVMLRKQSKEQMLPVHLDKEDIDQLPLTPGVYYFHDEKDRVIYVGKAKVLRKRVTSHFSGNQPGWQRQEFLRNIHRISYQQCGTELMAQLLETVEIKRLWPKYNRAAKHLEPAFAIYQYEDALGFLRLVVDKKRRNLQPLQTYFNLLHAQTALKRLADTAGLCYRLSCIDRSAGNTACSSPSCSGACTGKELPDSYNQKVKAATALLHQSPSFIIREPSRVDQSDACILVEQGTFYGMGYLPDTLMHLDATTVKQYLQPYPEYQLIRSLIHRHLQLQPHTVTWLS